MTRIQIDEEPIDAIFAPVYDCHASGGAIPESSQDVLCFNRGVDDVHFGPGITWPYSNGDSFQIGFERYIGRIQREPAVDEAIGNAN